ncbi:unnamed protein product [Protopolystoma xenopodis]|uniref:Uncharacterized protein n=1 Tax=Protopolystoma xenopodis TaxID=117903 RepID=A0A3S5A3N1_9PLAT|nr:unnamed protein product [Protopolystoma xenopodis]
MPSGAAPQARSEPGRSRQVGLLCRYPSDLVLALEAHQLSSPSGVATKTAGGHTPT